MTVDNVEAAIEAFRTGQCVLVMDAKDRENECDIFLHAEFCDEKKMAFMIRHTTGIICAVSDQQRLERFGLYPAAHANTDKNATNFYVSTDFLPETTTGVSAKDRAATLRAMVNLLHTPESFSKPGHMFPLCARPGGLLEREGHTEAAYDMCRLADMPTVAAIGELMSAEGKMLSFEESQKFAAEHNLVLVTVEELKQAVQAKFAATVDPEVARDFAEFSGCRLPSKFLGGSGRVTLYKCRGGVEVVALVKGEVRKQRNVPLRVHSECLTGDVLGSQRCDCGEQLQGFLQLLESRESGALLYVRGHEGRGMGLLNKLRAYAVQDDRNLDTIDANLHVGFHTDTRDYADVMDIIKNKLEILSVTLFSNNPEKLASLAPVVASVEPLAFKANPHNAKYLQTKKERLRHRTVMDTMQWGETTAAAAISSKVAVIAARWNADYVEPLLTECLAELENKHAEISVHRVPGALDLLAAARALLKKRGASVDAVVLIGVLIKGASDGYSASCTSLASGIAQLNSSAEFNVPVISGVLMCQDEAQAEERCAAQKLGAGFALEALEMVLLAKSI